MKTRDYRHFANIVKNYNVEGMTSEQALNHIIDKGRNGCMGCPLHRECGTVVSTVRLINAGYCQSHNSKVITELLNR